ncbi:MAG: putative membrane protein [Crocinitomicaceae bacterium]|jgi:putative membrane protein
MIISFSKNRFKQIAGIVYWNRFTLLFFAICAGVAYTLCVYFDYDHFCLPPIPVSILGGALAIFLGFRNSSAYDRWWEARKIWGAVVNDSRSLGLELITYPIAVSEEDEKEITVWRNNAIRRHIGWLYALNAHLRKAKIDLSPYMSEEEVKALSKKSNLPTHIMIAQAKAIKEAYDKGWIEEFRLIELTATLKKFYDDQGKAERIKNTIFPYYYNYFTMFFLWLFTLSLPFAMVSIQNNWVMIPMSIAISFAFFILNKSGVITETPFVGGAADTPISTICRGIEIDLLQMIDADDVPKPLEPTTGKFGVMYNS